MVLVLDPVFSRLDIFFSVDVINRRKLCVLVLGCIALKIRLCLKLNQTSFKMKLALTFVIGLWVAEDVVHPVC